MEAWWNDWYSIILLLIPILFHIKYELFSKQCDSSTTWTTLAWFTYLHSALVLSSAFSCWLLTFRFFALCSMFSFHVLLTVQVVIVLLGEKDIYEPMVVAIMIWRTLQVLPKKKTGSCQTGLTKCIGTCLMTPPLPPRTVVIIYQRCDVDEHATVVVVL